jgi:hypothetical protein
MQCACVLLSFKSSSTLEHFSTLSHKRTIFGNIEPKACVLFFPHFLTETFLILKRSERDMI